MFLDLFAGLHWWHWRWHWFELDHLGEVVYALAAVGVAWFVYRDARSRARLLFDMPPWLWGVVVLAVGLWGGVAYWVANCSGWVLPDSTGGRTSEPGPEPSSR